MRYAFVKHHARLPQRIIYCNEAAANVKCRHAPETLFQQFLEVHAARDVIEGLFQIARGERGLARKLDATLGRILHVALRNALEKDFVVFVFLFSRTPVVVLAVIAVAIAAIFVICLGGSLRGTLLVGELDVRLRPAAA